MKIQFHDIILGLSFVIASSVFAYGGVGGYHGGGGYHEGGYYHNGYYHNGYYNHGYNNSWHGNSVNVYDDGILYDDNLNDDTDMVIGVPAGGYYDPSCQTIDDCSTGTCVLVNTCGQ